MNEVNQPLILLLQPLHQQAIISIAGEFKSFFFPVWYKTVLL